MPFQSEKQRRFLHANHPEIAKRWEKEYAHGGILDINESEEIISDDGNDIELTDYNAAFDEPTGVKTLFQAKDGGRIGFQGGSGWGPGAGSPGTTSSGGNKNTGGGQYRGGGADVMAVSTPKSTYTGPTHSPHTDTPEQIAGQKEIDEAKAKRDFDYETEAYIKTVLRPQQIKTLTIMDKYENKIKPTYRDKFNDLKKAVKLGKNVMGATSSLFGFLSAGYALYKHYKEDKAFVNQLNKDIRTLKDMGIADFHHAVDTPVQTLEQLLTDRLNDRLKKDDIENNEGPKPIYNPVTLEVDEEYAQGDYDFNQWSNWNAMKQKQLLNAQLQEQWRAEKEASDQSFLVANSGGLANLFRVKNQ